jgi:hypothetical protein
MRRGLVREYMTVVLCQQNYDSVMQEALLHTHIMILLRQQHHDSLFEPSCFGNKSC